MDKKILIVDDQADTLDLLTVQLTHEGFNVISAESGAEALKLLEAHNDIPLVITDQTMPNMSGSELLLTIQQEYPNCVGMIISGYDRINDISHALDTGAIYKFITRPVKTRALIETVNDAYEHYQIRQAINQFRKEADGADQALVITDADYQVLSANENFSKMICISSFSL